MKKIALPFIAERLLGLTIPEEGRMYACSYAGLHEIDLDSDPVRIGTDHGRAEDYGALKEKGEALGLMGGTPLMSDARTRVHVVGQGETKLVHASHDGVTHRVSFDALSGDWFVATLSRCGRFLVLADPYLIDAYRL